MSPKRSIHYQIYSQPIYSPRKNTTYDRKTSWLIHTCFSSYPITLICCLRCWSCQRPELGWFLVSKLQDRDDQYFSNRHDHWFSLKSFETQTFYLYFHLQSTITNMIFPPSHSRTAAPKHNILLKSSICAT